MKKEKNDNQGKVQEYERKVSIDTTVSATPFRRTEFQSTSLHKTEFQSTSICLNDGVLAQDSSLDSLKRYINNFSCYDLVDKSYDLVYAIPDIVDVLSVGILHYDCHCDKYDYSIAAFIGVVTGLIDSFFVGMPDNSVLGAITDKLIDEKIIKFSNLIYQVDKKRNRKVPKKEPQTIASAIGFLEDRFRVCYDARFPNQLVGGESLRHFNPSSHHLKSLAHCPDIVGLFFSILDQFTNKTSIINEGSLLRLEALENKVELEGYSIVRKVINGFFIWLGHIRSDMGGSSGTRGHANRRGMGVPIPGFELLQFAGKDMNIEKKGLAMLTESMFLKGYDYRFGIAMSIPVIINDILVTLCWAIRERFCFDESWKAIVCSVLNNKRLVRMKLVSSGCFSLVDIGDAVIRSEGNLLIGALHVNYVGLCKFAFAGYKEILLRVQNSTQELIDSVLEDEWKKIFY